jgi:hypothetical protein
MLKQVKGETQRHSVSCLVTSGAAGFARVGAGSIESDSAAFYRRQPKGTLRPL